MDEINTVNKSIEKTKNESDEMFWRKKQKIIQVTEKIYSYSLKKVFESLNKGKAVAVPTDTVYGLISLLEFSDQLFHIKRRSLNKPFGLFVNDYSDISKFAHLTVSDAVLKSFFPGPVTLLFERRDDSLPITFNSGIKTVGFRIPQNGYIRDICRHYFGRPIVQTSANFSNAPLSPLCVEDFKSLHDELGLIIDTGPVTENNSSREGSTIVDLSITGHYRIVRNGCAANETLAILKRYGLIPLNNDDNENSKDQFLDEENYNKKNFSRA